jgi:Tfp pilus assembly protein PilP
LFINILIKIWDIEKLKLQKTIKEETKIKKIIISEEKNKIYVFVGDYIKILSNDGEEIKKFKFITKDEIIKNLILVNQGFFYFKKKKKVFFFI